MISPLRPTIGGPKPGFGLRVRKDGNRATASADFNCSCGHAEGPVTGDVEAESLVIRAGRHMRDECANPAVRAAAALRYARLQQSMSRRQKRK